MLTFLYTLMSMVIGMMITAIFYLHNDNKKLRERNKILDNAAEANFAMYAHLKNTGKDKNELSVPVEHELQGELEADDDTYNRIIQEWIYGAEAEEEGGIDGQNN